VKISNIQFFSRVFRTGYNPQMWTSFGNTQKFPDFEKSLGKSFTDVENRVGLKRSGKNKVCLKCTRPCNVYSHQWNMILIDKKCAEYLIFILGVWLVKEDFFFGFEKELYSRVYIPPL
jgi:hypothetical protein